MPLAYRQTARDSILLDLQHTAHRRFGGPLDVEAMCRAIREIVRRHDAVRTTFPSHLSPGDVMAGVEAGRQTRHHTERYIDIAHPAFDLGDVHVWRFATDRSNDEVDELHAFLSDGERRRAARFRFDDDCSRFIARRGLLRVVLARYAECDPARVAFELNAFGKPTLINGSSLRLQFNASHSAGIALVAVTIDRAVGIDIERHRPDFDCLGVAASFFSPDEVETLRRANEPLRRAMFFTLWSCKEAWVKARGMGLSFPLHRCRVAVGRGGPRLLEDPEQPDEHTRWSLTPLDVGPDSSAALIVASVPETHERRALDRHFHRGAGTRRAVSISPAES